MKFYFIWDAIDAIVATLLVLDIARFWLFAKKKGVKGVVRELAFFFKSPMETDEYNTHRQFEILKGWFEIGYNFSFPYLGSILHLTPKF